MVNKYNDELLCRWHDAALVPYSSNTNDGISGKFAASAVWEPYYTVNLYLNGGVVTGNILKNVGSAVQVQYAKSDNFKLPTPTKQGYRFIGWCTDKELSWCPTPNLYDGNFNKTYYAKYGSPISSGFSGDFKSINNLKPIKNPINIKPIK